jgi:hypothetical protein
MKYAVCFEIIFIDMCIPVVQIRTPWLIWLKQCKGPKQDIHAWLEWILLSVRTTLTITMLKENKSNKIILPLS